MSNTTTAVNPGTGGTAQPLSPTVDALLQAVGGLDGGGGNAVPQPQAPVQQAPKTAADTYNDALKQAKPLLEQARGYGEINATATKALEAMEDAYDAAAKADGEKKYDVATSSLQQAVTQARNVVQERDNEHAAFLDQQSKLGERLTKATAAADKLGTPSASVTQWRDTATRAQATAKATGEAPQENWPRTRGALSRFEFSIRSLEDSCRPVSTYEAARADLSRKEDVVKAITDTKGEKKNLKDAYQKVADQVQQKIDADDFDGATKLMPNLDRALQPAFVARQKDVEKATQKKIDKAKSSQTKGVFRSKVWEDVGSKSWQKMVDNIVDVQLDPGFQKEYDRVCEQVADDIAGDPIVKNAKAQWNTWMADQDGNKDDIEKFMNQVVALQSKRLGFDGPPVKTEPRPTRPTNVGSFSPSSGDITLNSLNAGNQDFEELLDTLTHENTHAYQTFLIKRLDGPVKLSDGTSAPKLKSGDPEYAAALALKLNDFPAGYIRPADAEQYPGNEDGDLEIYERQACEAHAFRAGERTGKAAFAKM